MPHPVGVYVLKKEIFYPKSEITYSINKGCMEKVIVIINQDKLFLDK